MTAQTLADHHDATCPMCTTKPRKRFWDEDTLAAAMFVIAALVVIMLGVML